MKLGLENEDWSLEDIFGILNLKGAFYCVKCYAMLLHYVMQSTQPRSQYFKHSSFAKLDFPGLLTQKRIFILTFSHMAVSISNVSYWSSSQYLKPLISVLNKTVNAFLFLLVVLFPNKFKDHICILYICVTLVIHCNSWEQMKFLVLAFSLSFLTDESSESSCCRGCENWTWKLVLFHTLNVTPSLQVIFF